MAFSGNFPAPMYSAAASGIAAAASGTDIFALKGDGIKTLRVRRVVVSGIATAAGAQIVSLIKRSTVNTGGTATTPTPVPHRSKNPATVGVFQAYTANPTTGTAIGTVAARRLTVPTAASSAIPSSPSSIEFNFPDGQELYLEGTEQLAVNLGGAILSGLTMECDMAWTEEVAQ